MANLKKPVAIETAFATYQLTEILGEGGAGRVYGDNLTLTLDRPVTERWVKALHAIGNHTSVAGRGPALFRFNGNIARVVCTDNETQMVINFFKEWLPKASHELRDQLKREAKFQKNQREQKLALEKAAQEKRLKLLRNVKI